jgi:hypothetical protein
MPRFDVPRLPSASPSGWLRRSLVVMAVIAVVSLLAGDALACPMCKAALGSADRSHGDWVGGFFWSILFMISMPFIILGSFSGYMYVLVRRARRERSGRDTVGLGIERFVDGPVQLDEAGSRAPATVDHA